MVLPKIYNLNGIDQSLKSKSFYCVNLIASNHFDVLEMNTSQVNVNMQKVESQKREQ